MRCVGGFAGAILVLTSALAASGCAAPRACAGPDSGPPEVFFDASSWLHAHTGASLEACLAARCTQLTTEKSATRLQSRGPTAVGHTVSQSAREERFLSKNPSNSRRYGRWALRDSPHRNDEVPQSRRARAGLKKAAGNRAIRPQHAQSLTEQLGRASFAFDAGPQPPRSNKARLLSPPKQARLATSITNRTTAVVRLFRTFRTPSDQAPNMRSAAPPGPL